MLNCIYHKSPYNHVGWTVLCELELDYSCDNSVSLFFLNVKLSVYALFVVDLRRLKLTVLNSFALTMPMRNFSNSSVW